jgi:hypothetical protein
MTTKSPVLMIGEFKVFAMAFTSNVERFKRLLNPSLITDARLQIMTCVAEVIELSVLEFLEAVNWKAYDTETDEELAF